MVVDYSKTPEFPDETALQDTGQYGWQRFRKPLLYPAELEAAKGNRYGHRDATMILVTYRHGFGYHYDWIHSAIRRALKMMAGFELDVRLVSYGTPSQAVLKMAKDSD